MNSFQALSRRTALSRLGLIGGGLVLGTLPNRFAVGAQALKRRSSAQLAGARRDIEDRVFRASLIDTHEHLPDESVRLSNPRPSIIPCDDWALLLSHYLNSDLLVAGMPRGDHDRLLSSGVDPLEKWRLLQPWWPAVKNTGYGQAVRFTLKKLYGVEDLSEKAIPRVQQEYEKTRRPGFYKRILKDLAGIASCQVNGLTGEPFRRSETPSLLMQDISIVGMFSGPNIGQYAGPAGIEVKSLSDWHRVIQWWFGTFAAQAVAVKSQNAYSRDIDYERVPGEKAAPIFEKVLRKDPVSGAERKLLEDHLFWHAVDEATSHRLPVKLHTGYYAGQNNMPLARLRANAGSAAELCRLSPATKFVFMHICYPYYEEMLALTKHFSNAYIDMCWSWIINPVAAKDYLKKHLVTAPSNKVLPFGGDYIPVEPVLGHSLMVRQGVAQALGELVEENWLELRDAVDLIQPIMNMNARTLFQLDRKGLV